MQSAPSQSRNVAAAGDDSGAGTQRGHDARQRAVLGSGWQSDDRESALGTGSAAQEIDLPADAADEVERGEPGAIFVECSTEAGSNGQRYALVRIGDETALPLLTAPADETMPAYDVWRGGLGLALPVARRVIEGHGGTLWSADGAHSRSASALRLPLRT